MGSKEKKSKREGKVKKSGKKKHKKSRHKRHRHSGTKSSKVQLPSDTLISGPLKAPTNFPEVGINNATLPDSKIHVNPSSKWVDKFFKPLEMPDREIANIVTQTFLPTSLGSFI